MKNITKKFAIGLVACSVLATHPYVTFAKEVMDDIVGSPYKTQIEYLMEKGILEGTTDTEVSPKESLTKVQAAAMLSRAFYLSEIAPQEVEGATGQKQVTYDSHMDSVNENFTLPSASDIMNTWGTTSLEGLIKIRAIDVENGKINPNQELTHAEWVEMVANVIIGVDYSENPVADAIKLGLFDENRATSTEVMTREEAANDLYNILAKQELQTLTVFATSDIHGNLIPYVPGGAQLTIGSVARMSELVNDMRTKNSNVLLVDAGDAPYNTNLANHSEGQVTIEVMNQMGYDAMTLGNHDFDMGQEALERNAKSAKFPFVSANVYQNGKYPDFLKKSTIVELNGIKVGIVGATDHNSAKTTHAKNTLGIEFEDHTQAVVNEVNRIRSEVDVVILLSHLHGDNDDVLQAVEGVDISIGGGQDIVALPQKINGNMLINPGKHGETLNQININLIDNKVVGMNVGHIFMSANLQEDQAIQTIVDRYQANLESDLEKVIGKANVFLDGERSSVRLKESNMGNVICDALVAETGADLGFSNGGGMRASIDKGDITLSDVYSVLQFDNTVVVVDATGQTIWETLENAVSQYPSAVGGFLQVSKELAYTFDAAKPAGERILEVLYKGEAIELDKVYRVVTNDFLTTGGDGFDMLRDDATLVYETQFYLRDAFANYIKAQGTISAQLEGRIKILNAPQN